MGDSYSSSGPGKEQSSQGQLMCHVLSLSQVELTVASLLFWCSISHLLSGTGVLPPPPHPGLPESSRETRIPMKLGNAIWLHPECHMPLLWDHTLRHFARKLNRKQMANVRGPHTTEKAKE